LAGELYVVERDSSGRFTNPEGMEGDSIRLPGLRRCPADPSTENIARWIKDACQEFVPGMVISVRIDETCTNAVEV
jgi:hypothetical protein